MEQGDAAGALVALGFNETEASVYCALLREPATGYRLAQAIGKSPPNVYHALGALREKGAVLADDADGRTYRAVPAAELLDSLGRRFALRSEEARGALAEIETAVSDDRLYHLKTADQVMTRVRAMIRSAREILLFELFPSMFDLLADEFAAAAASGVTVAGLTYSEAAAPGVTCVPSTQPATILQRWPGQQLSLVADAREHLLALLTHDGRRVHHALWSDGAYLSALQHSAIACEMRLSRLSPENDDALAGFSLLNAFPPGLRALLGEAAETGEEEAA